MSVIEQPLRVITMELEKVYTVLIINNSRERLPELQTLFQRAGYNVLQATDSKSACRSAFEQQPDVILIEESESAVDQALVLRLREIELTSRIPILLTTSAASLNLVQETEARNPNPSASLPIPYDDLELIAIV